jgi:hypothetical protein
MTRDEPSLPDWERLLAAERHVQKLIPGTVLVGGTAAALHAGHRRSHDGDHVLGDLRERFDDVLETLEAVAGWKTERVRRPVLVLGGLDGISTGIRQLRRTEPLEVETVEGLRIPTLPEMARIKAWLLATRNSVRDYLDLVVLLERLGDDEAARALTRLDALYPQPEASVTAEVIERLASAAPADLPEVELASYRDLVAPWNRWEHVQERGRLHAGVLARALLGGATP